MAKNIFNSVKLTRPKKNTFDMSHDVKMSLQLGKLYPTMVMKCIPGDKFNIGCESLLRFAPLTSPVMHMLNVFMHYFFVPHRILWPGWSKWWTNTPDPVTLPAFPTVVMDEGWAITGRLADYLGIPPALPMQSETVSAFPFAAYQAIVNEYYRDQKQMAEIDFELINGDNSANNDLFVLRTRCWEHDYFTSALPEPQKGEAVSMPIGGFIDVPVRINQPIDPYPEYVNLDGTLNPGLTSQDAIVTNVHSDSLTPDVPDPLANSQLYAATSEIEGGTTTITDLRRAEAIQKWLERINLSGSRPVEANWAMFGVHTQDARLQRPEYITGTKSPVIISEVLNTAGLNEAPESRPQGDMAGHGVSVTAGKYANYTCYEHGWIIGIMSVMPNPAYMQGIERHWLDYEDPYQQFFNQFEHIGEQEIQNREVYAYQGLASKETFGYNPRYSEYKYMNNRVAGQFRSTLKHWHFGREFDTPPVLNEEFMQCQPRLDPFAVVDDSVDHIYAHVYHKIKATRGMSKYGTPSL